MKMENKIPNEKKIDWNAWDEAYGLLKEKGFATVNKIFHNI